MSRNTVYPRRQTNAMTQRLSLAISLLLLVTLIGCTAAEHSSATQTAAGVAEPTQTRTPAGDLLRIDGELVRHVYVPTIDEPARYAMTDERLYVWATDEWQPTETRYDGRTILVDPSDPLRLFRGDHPACDREPAQTITFSKSEDGGQTWRAIPAGDNIQPLAMDPQIKDVLYGTNCGLTISTDAGETWDSYYRSVDFTVLDIAIVQDRLLLLERSTRGLGRIVEIRVTDPENPELVDVLLEEQSIYALDADENRIIVASAKGVSISLDGGRTWTMTKLGLEGVVLGEEDAPLPQATENPGPERGVLSVQLDPTNSSQIFAGTVRGLYISQDNGVTWAPYAAATLDASVVDIQIGDSASDLFVTTERGVLVAPKP